MGRFSRLFALGLAIAGSAGCAPEASPPPVTANAAATPDRSGLRFLLSSGRSGAATTRAANQALVQVMEQAGYSIVSEPGERFDAELVTRTTITSRELELTESSSRVFETAERVQLSVSVVVGSRLVDGVRADFVARNGQVAPADVVPAVNALGRSARVAELGAKVREDRAARARESARTALR
jgi:hypothetical protein